MNSKLTLAGQLGSTVMILAVMTAALGIVAQWLLTYSAGMAGTWLGLTMAGLTSLALWPWKARAVRQGGTPAARTAALAQLSLWASVLRFGCLILMAWWGFQTSVYFGLSGILSFGFAFLLTTSVELSFLRRKVTA